MTRTRCGDERGTTDALGLALLAPVILAGAFAILALSRDVDARATAQSAAEAAAQAAAQERNPVAALDAARRVGNSMLIDERTCASPSVTLGPDPFVPGGRVSVTVSCTASLSGLETSGATQRSAQTFTAFAVIDPYRAVDE